MRIIGNTIAIELGAASQQAGTLTVYSVNGSTTQGPVSTAHGTFTWLTDDGSFSYTPNSGFVGVDSVMYIASTGSAFTGGATISIRTFPPTISLLDDANNDGTVDTSDQPFKNAGAGKVIVVSDDSGGGITNADAAHLAQLKVSVAFVASSAPFSLSGWTLKLTSSDPSHVKFWTSLGKTSPLDTSGVVDLSGGLASLPYTNGNIYVELTAIETQTLTLSLIDATNTIVSQDTVTVTAKQGTLSADRVYTTSSGMTVGQALPRPFQDANGAVVPLSNEDSLYVELLLDLVPDKDQTTAIAGDKFLLPVEIHGTAGAGTYALLIPGNIHVWNNPNHDRGTNDNPGLLTGSPAVITLDGSGNAFVYVEGIADGPGTLTLQWRAGGGAYTDIDTLAITVFNFAGPQYVPEYSTYHYGVVGLLPTPAASWSVAGDKLVASDALTATAEWNGGPADKGHLGVLTYNVNSYYTWSYYVSTVLIKVKAEDDFTPGTPHLEDDSVHPGTRLDLLSQSATLTPGLIWNADVEMVPRGYNAVGQPIGDSQITVGFVQHVDGFHANATYSNGHSLINVTSSNTVPSEYDYPMIDMFEHSHWPWYADKPLPNELVPQSGNKTFGGKLTSNDIPRTFVYKYYSKDDLTPTNQIVSLDVQYNFTLDIAAFVADSDEANKVYTRVATQQWSYTVNGNFTSPTVGGFGAPTNVNVVATDQNSKRWKPVTDGSTENNYHVGTDQKFNDYVGTSDYEDPTP